MPYFGDYVFDSQGNVVPGATITVATQAGAAATIYSDALRTTTITSLTTGSDGSYEFYIASGRYTITAQYQGFSQTDTFDLGVAGIETVTDFGADPTGVADSTAAWLAFKTHCVTTGTPGYLPSGTYLIDAFSFAGNSGLKLFGASKNPNISQVSGAPQTILKLRSASSTFVTINSVYDLDVQDIHFDGGQFADTVVSFPGTIAVTGCTFERCSFDGATPTTGRTFYIVGSIQVDNTRFRYCNVGQVLGGNGSVKASRLIENTNTNALNIWFEHSYFEDADYMFVFGAGSCSFYRCDFFRAVTRFFYISSVTQSFTIYDPYTEGADNVPFLIQAGSAGVTSQHPITIEKGNLNAINTLLLNCQQPVRLLGFNTGGDVDITPMATYGVYNVFAEGVGFVAGKGFTGTGASTNLIQINCAVDTIAQATKVSGLLQTEGKIYPGTDAAVMQTAAGIYAGSGAPNNANGSNGDFYLRGDGTAAGNTVIYHKEGGSWVALTTT
jgi:hypothetical protein